MSPYTPIASEYYDVSRHPTCSNFGELSRLFLEPALQVLLPKSKYTVELGAGRSLVAPIMSELGIPLNRLVLIDVSMAMLEHSRQWATRGAQLTIADARDTGLPARTANVIVSSLGDPYNTLNLWIEIARILSSDGTFLFTTPANEWAERFRSTDKTIAEFVLQNGQVVRVPSFVPTTQEQRQMIEKAGLALVAEHTYCANAVQGYLSPKLRNPLDLENSVPVLRAYKVQHRK